LVAAARETKSDSRGGESLWKFGIQRKKRDFKNRIRSDFAATLTQMAREIS
jgi:hypothetical protein